MSTSAELLAALEPMARLIPGRRNPFGALGYGIGRRLARGRLTPERCMLVFVSRKSAAPRAPLPRQVPGTRVPIDIVALGSSLEPSDELELPEDPGGLSAASPLGLRSGAWQCAAGFGLPFEAPEFVVTVRHPFAEQPVGSAVFSFQRQIGRLAMAAGFGGQDLALVRLEPGEALAPALPSGEVLSGAGAGQFLHLGAALNFYSPVRGSLARPRVLAIRVTAFLLPFGGGAAVEQNRMLMTEAATSPGDSGAPLFDAAGTVVGLASFRTDQFSFFEGVGHGRLEQLLGEVSER